ncbi:MAG TPA: CBS domain-containing protein [bacterium]|nr:CBS domain-containing protein [bacterium]
MTHPSYKFSPVIIIKGRGCRHLPVFENNRLIGIVSIGDFVNLLMGKKVL